MKDNYNPQYLRGDTEYTDDMFQADMAKNGINIPDELLGDPKMHLYIADQVRNTSKAGLTAHVNPDTGVKYTQEEADAYADAAYDQVVTKMSSLCGCDLTKL